MYLSAATIRGYYRLYSRCDQSVIKKWDSNHFACLWTLPRVCIELFHLIFHDSRYRSTVSFCMIASPGKLLNYHSATAELTYFGFNVAELKSRGSFRKFLGTRTHPSVWLISCWARYCPQHLVNTYESTRCSIKLHTIMYNSCVIEVAGGNVGDVIIAQ